MDYESSIEKCKDSSRGYAVKLTNDDGRSTWVGIVFHDRNSAFDFQEFIEDFRNKTKKINKKIEIDPQLMDLLKNNYQKGGKIKVSLKLEDGKNIKSDQNTIKDQEPKIIKNKNESEIDFLSY